MTDNANPPTPLRNTRPATLDEVHEALLVLRDKYATSDEALAVIGLIGGLIATIPPCRCSAPGTRREGADIVPFPSTH